MNMQSDSAWQILQSHQDASVNFTRPFGAGLLEARYVRRVPEYFIAYLSSQSGCDRACRMCHLTATGQTTMDQAEYGDFISQANIVFDHYDRLKFPADFMNFNWMARGEPLLNPTLTKRWEALSAALGSRAKSRGLRPQFNISTIMPRDSDLELTTWFRDGQAPSIYYSLYSLDPAFRKRWLPKAATPETAFRVLADWQAVSGAEVVLHWAFIKDENDTRANAEAIAGLTREFGLRFRFNAVRYNPFDARRGGEASDADVAESFEIMADAARIPGSRIVPRVGLDVKASCGTFLSA
jgi:adenine C2-methylase RlmN of 23S rRNA A2503 and tRNA A37